MAKLKPIISVLVLWTSYCAVLGFVIDAQPQAERIDLSDALDALERQRRQLGGQYFKDRDLFPYYKHSNPGLTREDNFLAHLDKTDDAPDRFSLEELYRSLENGNAQTEDTDNPLTETSKDELEHIFDEASNENGASESSEDTKDYTDPTSKTDSKLIAEASKMMPRSTDVVEDDGAPSDVGDEGVNDDTSDAGNEAPDVQQVTKEELESLFNKGGSPEESADETESEATYDGGNESITHGDGDSNTRMEDLPMFWGRPSYKKKRMTKRGVSFRDVMAEKDQEIQDLKEKVERLKTKEELEDREIDLLADALDKVTRGDIMGGDEDTRSEYGDLQRAIDIEEALNSLDDIDRATSIRDHTEPELFENEEDRYPAKKRGEPDYKHKKSLDMSPVLEDNMGRWFNHPIPNDEIDDANIPLLKTRSDRSDNAQDVPDVITEDEIREAVAELDPWEKAALASKLDEVQREEELEEEMESECPNVNTYTTDCAFADGLGIYMDDEAKELCNRHEICYTCGASIGLSVYKCDAGYLGDAVGACEGEYKCIYRAERFLATMKEAHFYDKHKELRCSNRCIKDFILGVST